MQIFELFGSILLKDDGIESKLDNIDKKASGTHKTITNSFNGIASAALKVGSIIGSGLGLFKLAESASDLTEAQNVVETTFKSSGKAIEAWAQTTAKSAGISETASTKWVGFMGAMLKSSGVTEQSAGDMSKSLVQLTGDMSSFYNVSTSDMWEKLRSGISGETEPLKALGINMSVANLQAYALAEGIKKPYKEMTQGEQTTLRYNYLMKTTADAQGDFGKTLSGSFANQVRVAQLNLETLGKSIGTGLLPWFNKAFVFINENMPKIQQIVTSSINFIIPKFTELVTKISDFVIPIFSKFTDFVKENFPKIKEFIIDMVEIVVPKFQKIADIVIKIAKELFPDMQKSTIDLRDEVKGLTENGLNLVIAALTWVKDNIGLVEAGVVALTAVWVIQQGIILAHNTALVAHNIVQGVKMVQDKAETIAIVALYAAEGIHNGVLAAGTAAQWLFNAAMTANPIGIVIVALAALGVAIYEVVKHWKDIVEWIEKAWNWLKTWNDTPIADKTSTVTTRQVTVYGGTGDDSNYDPVPDTGTGLGYGYASGTDYASPGWHWVGENGAELMNFRGGEQVIPHNESIKIASKQTEKDSYLNTPNSGSSIAYHISIENVITPNVDNFVSQMKNLSYM